MDRAFLQERITKLKSVIVAYEDALIALSSGVQSYKLDTGQTQQTVSRYDIVNIQKNLDACANQLCVYQNRLNGTGVVIGRPVC
jgi:hypothetical protein